jgi:Late exocytosis, associated with Golgi transport
MDFVHHSAMELPPILQSSPWDHHPFLRRMPDGQARIESTKTKFPNPVVTLAPTIAPSASFSPTTTPLVTNSDSMLIKETLSLYGSFYVVCFVLFCLLRKHVPRLYNIRSWVPELKCDLAVQSLDCDNEGFLASYVSWTWKVYQVSDDDLLKQCGMDALCFIRCLRLGWKLSCFGVFNSFWLIPLFVTAKSTSETEYLTDKFVVSR